MNTHSVHLARATFKLHWSLVNRFDRINQRFVFICNIHLLLFGAFFSLVFCWKSYTERLATSFATLLQLLFARRSATADRTQTELVPKNRKSIIGNCQAIGKWFYSRILFIFSVCVCACVSALLLFTEIKRNKVEK